METRRWGLIIASAAVACLVAPRPVGAQTSTKVTAELKTVVETVRVGGRRGQIDWTNGVIAIRAAGLAKRGTIGAQAKLTAREAAITVALRDLAQIVHGVRVTGRTTVRDLALADSEIRTEVEGFVKAGAISDEKWDPTEGEYWVTMTVRLFGEEGLSAQVFPEMTPETVEKAERIAARIPEDQPLPPEPIKVPETAPALAPDVAPVLQAEQEGPFTGLIVDCRGLGVKPGMSPRILRQDGSEVWGTIRVDPQVVIDRGIAGYLPNMEAAKGSRAGDQPLVIRAVGKAGSCSTDVIVSDEDAQSILEADAKYKFFEKLNVIFLVDRNAK